VPQCQPGGKQELKALEFLKPNWCPHGSAMANSIDWGATVPSWVVVVGLRYWVWVGMVGLGVQGHIVV
jgi:hypothetical protein